MKSSNILEDAADYIEQHGWCQQDYFNANGNVCTQGAIMAVRTRYEADNINIYSTSNDIDTITEAFLEALDQVSLFVGDAVSLWNDDPDRTKEEVVKTLRKVAEVARQCESE